MIAPDQSGLNTRPEIRQIQRRHHMSVLDGMVTAADIYQAARETAFDVHHYATDGGEEGVLLSNGVIFGNEEIGQIARIHETPCLFFNSCESARSASYVVRHGVRYAVYTTIKLPDSEAWKPAIAFYESLQNGHGKDYVGAYIVADSGDGDYGLSVDPNHICGLEKLASTYDPSDGRLSITRAEVLYWCVAAATLSVGLSWLLVRLGGGG